jgi:VanZ family protein
MSQATVQNRNIRYRFPVLFYMFLLFCLSSMPGPPPDASAIPNFDKILHFLAYTGLGVVLMHLFHTSPTQRIARQAIFLTILTGTMYGMSDEWHQSFIPGRDASLLDAAFDSLGCMAAALLYRPLGRRFIFPSMNVAQGNERDLTCPPPS